MHLKRTRTQTPLPEEYTRVTNPERLLPLIDLAVDIMSDLRNAYEVSESSTFDHPPRLRSPFDYDRPPITLTPVSPNEAPIAIAFTTFPGLFVRCGSFFEESFPVCGCDGCAPTLETEAERLRETLGSVVAGHFMEEIEIPLMGSGRLSWSFSLYGSSSGWMTLSRVDARKLSSGSRRIEWRPWTKRTGEPGISRVHSNTR